MQPNRTTTTGERTRTSTSTSSLGGLDYSGQQLRLRGDSARCHNRQRRPLQDQCRFGSDMADLQWVVDAYTLGFAALLLSAGVVVDRLGSKHVFVTGFVGFAAASLACGLAPRPGFLNATRAIQGIGAALLVPSSLAILNDACAHDSRLRARAIGIWTAAGGVAIAAGPVVGGLLLNWLGWRSIFLVNLPICAFGLALDAALGTANATGQRETSFFRSSRAGAGHRRADRAHRRRH